LEGVMRTEFGEGLDLQGAAAEASTEVVAPDRAMFVAAPDGHIVAGWGRAFALSWLPPLDATTAVRQELTVRGEPWRAIGQVVDIGPHRYLAVVAAPLEELNHSYREMLIALAIGVLVALVVAAIGGGVIGRQILRPLEAMARQATAITDRDAAGRLKTPHTYDELGRLAAAFNALLDRLASALRTQRQFMADASHELRTPVSVIRTAAEVTLRRDDRTTDEYREALGIVSDQSQRLTRLVDAMLMLSRAEVDGLPLDRVPLYVNDLVTDAARSMRVLADERGIRLEHLDRPELPASGDEHLLRQMFSNLLDNAIRHAACTVTVSMERQADTVAVRIANDGPSIPPSDRDRIFERFVRLNGSPGSAGLGLPIARTIAEAHAGRVVLEDSTTGASFVVMLPADLDR
ncbi:MAG TPA: ATP-binding protein, partial [Vicinamibacterales bacterium]|nr:ATP-binding protein [Vicinamibacterales bacterium]